MGEYPGRPFRLLRNISAEYLLLAAYSAFFVNWYVQTLVVPFGFANAILSVNLFCYGAIAIAIAVCILNAGSFVKSIHGNKFFYLFLLYIALNAVLLADHQSHLRYSWQSLGICSASLVIFLSVKSLHRIPLALFAASLVFILIYSGLVAAYLSTLPSAVFRLKFAMTGVSNPGIISASLIPIAMALLAFLGGRRSLPWILIVFTCIILTGWLFGLCYSYAAFIGLGSGALVLAYFQRNSATNAAILAGLLGVILGMMMTSYHYAEDAEKLFIDNVRLRIWREFFALALERPVFGHGFTNDVSVLARAYPGSDYMHKYRFAHNGILHVFVQGGLVGLILFCAVAIEVGQKIYRTARGGITYPLAYLFASAPIFLTITGALLYWVPAYVMTGVGLVIVTNAASVAVDKD